MVQGCTPYSLPMDVPSSTDSTLAHSTRLTRLTRLWARLDWLDSTWWCKSFTRGCKISRLGCDITSLHPPARGYGARGSGSSTALLCLILTFVFYKCKERRLETDVSAFVAGLSMWSFHRPCNVTHCKVFSPFCAQCTLMGSKVAR